MKSIRLLDRRLGFSFASVMVLVAMVVPSLIPAFASAASITSRSIQMSTSTISATTTGYTVSFTSPSALAIGGGYFIDFCGDSPIIGVSCGALSGFSDTGTTGTGGTITSPAATRVKVVLTSAVSAAGTATAVLNNITNPSAVGTFYARIYTYANSTDLATYTSPTVLGTVADSGGIALSTTNSIGVSATVMETMTFCTAQTGWTPATNCTGATAPSLILGSGSPVSLGTTLSTATAYAELSTNAASGATVRMTNSNPCGGLRRNSAGATACDIAPTNTANAIATGSGLFGLNVGTAVTSLSGASGTLTPLAPYSSTTYGMTYTGASTGVTSAYGDPIFNSGSAPVSNVYVPLTFGAAASNTTPAGVYSASMNLVATGTF